MGRVLPLVDYCTGWQLNHIRGFLSIVLNSLLSFPPTEDLLSSDTLIPLLLLTILRSNVTNLTSNLSYMRDFSFERDVTTGEYGYALSTLEGVVHYILGNVQSLSVISRRNKRYWRA